jgi:hypothetical protein
LDGLGQQRPILDPVTPGPAFGAPVQERAVPIATHSNVSNQSDTWLCFRPLIIAHDVGRSRDRSTAVVGGLGPFEPRLIGIKEAEELPQGLMEVRVRVRSQQSIATIILMLSLSQNLSNDTTYAEVLYETWVRAWLVFRSVAMAMA